MQLEKNSKRDYKTKIIRFLTDQDPAPLTADEEKVLSRWEMADRLLRAKEPQAYVIDQLIKTFGVSSTTASNDLYQAMDVFGRSRRLNKNYLLSHHLERIDKMLVKIQEKWDELGQDGKPNYHPDPKEIAAVARLTESYTYALNSLPAQNDQAILPPPLMIFRGLNGTTVATGMTYEQALEYADDILNGKIPGDAANQPNT